MAILRRTLIVLLALTGTLLSPLAFVQAQSAVDPKPHPSLGLHFALSPGAVNTSIIEPTHNGSSIVSRQTSQLSSWITHWYPPPVCSNGVCSITSLDDIPHIQINGEGYTVGGRVFAGIYDWPANTLRWGMNFNVKSWPGYRGGSFGVHAPTIDCSRPGVSHVGDSYAAAYDWTTGRWSPITWLYTHCAVL